MVLREFLLLAVAHWLALVSPGPDFFLLLRNASRHGRRHGIGTSFGIACANGIYIVLALTGFSLLQQSPALLVSMKLVASAYLAYLGWCTLRSSANSPAAMQTAIIAATARHASPAGLAAGWFSGLLWAGLNPKNALFYLGLFTLMVDAATSMPVKTLYGLWMFAAVFLWDAALVLLVSNRHIVGRIARHAVQAEKLAGAILLLAAIVIAVSTLATWGT